MSQLKSHLRALLDRADQIERELSNPDIQPGSERYRALTREHARMRLIMEKIHELADAEKQLGGLSALPSEESAEMKAMVQEETAQLKDRITVLEQELQIAILPPDPHADKDILIEIRAGAGGDEASLFASELYRMYCRYCEGRGWKTELIESSPSEAGGVKEVIVSVMGEGVWPIMKFESGVHRVQRVPQTEASGRIHTSTVTVAVLPEASEVDVKINPGEVRIDTYRASGAGGQHINKTESAVRLTHLPTGIVVACQDQRSQIKNREKAFKVLRAKLLSHAEETAEKELSAARKAQIGTGDRSEKIRTYNFPQDRVTDHRIGYSQRNIESLMEGDLRDLLAALQKEEQRRLLETLNI